MRFSLKTAFILLTVNAFFMTGLRHSIDRTPGPPQGIAYWLSCSDSERRIATNGSIVSGVIDKTVSLVAPNWGKRPESP